MTADEYRDFLLAVVNAHDRSIREGLRKRFVRLYRGWFPDDMKGEGADEAVHVLLFAYRPFQMWFFKDAPIFENPQTEFALHVAILRDKLKSIWIAGTATDSAKYRLEELKQDTREYRGGKKNGQESWRKRTLNALEWLGGDLSRLLTCANPKCELETRLFFRQHNNDRYCSTECSSSAQQEKRMERRAAKSKPFIRSDDARMNMSEGAKRRWRDDGDKKSAPNGKSIKKRVRRTAHEVRNTPLPPSASEETPPPSMLPTPTVGHTEQKIDNSSHMQTSAIQEPRCGFCGKSQTDTALDFSVIRIFASLHLRRMRYCLQWLG